MTRPDPAVDLIGYLRWLGDKIEALEQGKEEARVTAADAARALGFTPTYFHSRPWRVPDFGLHGTMHTLKVWKAWLDRPESKRRSEWDSMDLQSRRHARGVA